jgi:hypothetical protein
LFGGIAVTDTLLSTPAQRGGCRKASFTAADAIIVAHSGR